MTPAAPDPKHLFLHGESCPPTLSPALKKEPSFFSCLWGIQAVGIFPFFSLEMIQTPAQSPGAWNGSHRGRGGGKRPLRPRETPSSGGGALPAALRGWCGTRPRAFPQSPSTCLAVHSARSLCHGALTALCLCVIWTVASLPLHLVPLPTGTVLATPTPLPRAYWRRAPSLGSSC